MHASNLMSGDLSCQPRSPLRRNPAVKHIDAARLENDLGYRTAYMVDYRDRVGKIHTPAAGSTKLDVPLVQMNALLGFVADALIGEILAMGLERDREARTLRAFNKLLWLQNDLINRHYATGHRTA